MACASACGCILFHIFSAVYTIYSSCSYACATNINRGNAACSNRLRIPRKILEGALLDVIRKELLSEEAIEVFIQETALALKKSNLSKGRSITRISET